MLKSLHIQNFQSYKDSTFEFGPGVNVIVGTSNAGKSAVVRAIYSILKNRPLGNGFIRKGTEEFILDSVWDQNGKIIEVGRKRNNKTDENLYSLTGYDDFTSPGNGPPPKAVLEALNLSDINTQKQFSPHFLIFDSPGQISKYIRTMTGLEKIDEIAKKLASRIKKNKATTTGKEQSLKATQAKLKVLQAIPIQKLEASIDKSEELIASVALMGDNHDRLSGIHQQLKELIAQKKDIPEKRFKEIKQEIILQTKKFQEDSSNGDRLFAVLELWEELRTQAIKVSEEQFVIIKQRISDISRGYAVNKSKEQQLQKGISLWKQLEAEELKISLTTPDYGLSLIESYKKSCKDLWSLHGIVEQIQSINVATLVHQRELSKLKEQEVKLKSQLKNCPHCDSELVERTKQILLEK